jgi:hypothetical protein
MGLFATHAATAQQTQPPDCTTNFVYFAAGSHALTPEDTAVRFAELGFSKRRVWIRDFAGSLLGRI